MSMSDLAAALGVQPPTVTKMISRLAAQDYVERRASAGDGRQAQVFLTERGRRAIATIDKLWKRIEKTALAGIDDKDRKRLRKLLRQVERNLGGERGRPLRRGRRGRIRRGRRARLSRYAAAGAFALDRRGGLTSANPHHSEVRPCPLKYDFTNRIAVVTGGAAGHRPRGRRAPARRRRRGRDLGPRQGTRRGDRRRAFRPRQGHRAGRRRLRRQAGRGRARRRP